MTNFVTEECCSCYMPFQVPKGFQAERQRDKQSFYCPRGHAMSYRGEREEDRLRRELDKLKQNTAYLEDDARHQRDRAERAERRRVALSGQVTKLKKRSAAGVCPCCNRTFLGLARHMAQKHPTFIAEPMADNVIQLGQDGKPDRIARPCEHG